MSLASMSRLLNVGKKSQEKKSRKKVTDLGRKKSQRKKKSQKRIMLFLNFWLGVNIFIFIITIFITLCFVWIDALAFLCLT